MSKQFKLKSDVVIPAGTILIAEEGDTGYISAKVENASIRLDVTNPEHAALVEEDVPAEETAQVENGAQTGSGSKEGNAE